MLILYYRCCGTVRFSNSAEYDCASRGVPSGREKYATSELPASVTMAIFIDAYMHIIGLHPKPADISQFRVLPNTTEKFTA